MTTDAFANRLSDYVDDEITAVERIAIKAHLARCAECRETVEELRSVVAHAASLEDAAPAGDLWPGVAARVSAQRGTWWLLRRLISSQRFSFTLPQLAAAGLAIVVLTGGLVWMARSGDPRVDFEPVSAHGDVAARPGRPTPAEPTDTHYDEAVANLERVLESRRPRLDPEIAWILEENLAAIDRAIDQSRRALAADPANAYLKRHVAGMRERKLALLRRAGALAGE
jgi:hypothetical protein